MEILELRAEPFCRISSIIGQAIIILAQDRAPDAKALVGTLGELQREAQRLGLRSTDQQLVRIRESLSRFNDNQFMHGMISELYNRMRDELSDRFFLAIPAENVPLYQQKEPLFGPSVESKFPEMSEDISEAGKCLGLNRPTAAMFHLMRIMEIAVQRFGDKLGIKLVAEKNWQNILDEINKAIRALNHKDSMTKAYAEASAHLYNVKLCWRNPVMHPKQTYTPDEARAVFAACKTFINDLVDLV